MYYIKLLYEETIRENVFPKCQELHFKKDKLNKIIIKDFSDWLQMQILIQVF